MKQLIFNELYEMFDLALDEFASVDNFQPTQEEINNRVNSIRFKADRAANIVSIYLDKINKKVV